jgi:carboxypeptidase Taq
MANTFAPYKKLLKRFRQIALLGSTAELLSWDQETFMPPKAVAWRAEQLAHLSGATHRLATAKTVGDWIKACEDHGFLAESDEAVNVREWRRDYDRATKIPTRLVEKLERVRTLSREAWVAARRDSKFKVFKPHLQRIVDLQLQLADCWGYEDSPYDALLDEYEPGARSRQLRELFGRLRPEIVAVLGPAVERSKAIPADLLDGHYPVETQQAFNRKVAEAMGFDFEAGRIDTTTHPFCTGLGPQDCRLTTRYNERNFTQSLYGIMHEAGHGLYDQGLPAERFGTPLGTFCSLGIHESQSRLWENHVGRSSAFWEHWHPIACDHFPHLKSFTPEQITAAVNRVQPSFIRVEADEVTYDLHIALRFDIELRLIQRELTVAEVPGVWNELFEHSFGLKVDQDSNGCLQDIHWSLGSFGYFPTYTLGNLNASQLLRRSRAEVGGMEDSLARGEYGPLLQWLRTRVHTQGRRFNADSLMERATGEPTKTVHYLEHLRARFG